MRWVSGPIVSGSRSAGLATSPPAAGAREVGPPRAPTARGRLRAAGRAAILALAAAVPVTACVDFADPLGPAAPDQGAQVHVTIQLLDRGATGFASVDAQLVPGSSATGVWFPLANDTLRVLGVPFTPVGLREGVIHVYDGVVPLPPAHFADTVVTVQVPRVEGIAADPGGIRWFAPGRAGPDTVRYVPGTELVLRVAPRRGPGEPPPSFERWNLNLAGGGNVISLGALGPPPEEIRVPAEWVPEVAVGSFSASLDHFQMRTHVPPPGDYRLGLTLQTQLFWTVVAEPPEADGP